MERKEGYVLRKLHRCLNSMAAWCERWNMKISEDTTRAIYFSYGIRPPESLLVLNGRNIPFVTSAKYLGVIFEKKTTWRLHGAKDFRTFIRIYFLFKSEWLSTTLNLALQKVLKRSVMTYACPVWEFLEDTHLMKYERLQNKVLRTIGNFPRCTPLRDMHMAFHLLYVYDNVTKLSRKQAGVVLNHGDENVRNIAQGEA
jgi:hypothetical protein